ncbi:MAG: DUF1849 domain-containing protein [Hyphomicrobiales bacterium]|mgnify:FL=1|nr:MAG: DUF1849 domain-containing protein [Hyphomicrobiales bacterium]
MRAALAAELVLATVLCAPFAATAAEARAGALVPHRAVYDLALDSASDRSGITGITGRMVYEFGGSACDGYTVTFRFVTRIDTDEVSRLTDQQTTTYEDGEGRNFSFVTRSFVDETLDSELKGSARLGDGETVVSLEKPREEQFRLEATRFPTHHLMELLSKARAGETFYETTLFDGSEDADKVMTTTVVIGREARAKANDPELKALASLGKDAFWPVDMAYFDLGEANADGEELPSYRISFKLHESGVTRDLVMDYGDFSMSGTLVDLSLFDAPQRCTQ